MSTYSPTKIYIDLDIPETAKLKTKYIFSITYLHSVNNHSETTLNYQRF